MFLTAIVGLACSGGFHSEPPQRANLDALWESRMLEGSFAIINVDESGTHVSEEPSLPPIDPHVEELLSHGWLLRYRIIVESLGEGIFRRGGWVLMGGLLRRISDGSSTIEVYAKAVVRRFPYIPFPPHRDEPEEIGFEFFLLNRMPNAPATVVRKWVFLPNEIDLNNKDAAPDVRCVFKYEPATKAGIITIRGLKQPFEDRVDLLGLGRKN